MHQRVAFIMCLVCWLPYMQPAATAQVSVQYDVNATQQTIRNFAASDAWAGQFVGNWPEEKKNRIADLLFSIDTLEDGSPNGIGLSMWRYNIGAGSAAQGDSSGIKDEWRRAATYDAQDAQNWFLQAAKQRGVQQFLAFFNSPPATLTKNGKSFASKGRCNIDSTKYKAFAAYALTAIKHIQRATGVQFNYISPVNEPQWDWSDGGQEGCPYTNKEILGVTRAFNDVFKKTRVKILIPESGHHKYLFAGTDKPGKDNMVAEFSSYMNKMPAVAKVIASHSYFTTSPNSEAIAIRNRIKKEDIEYWQSEYCILGDNAGEINGSRRDTGMRSALYVARVIHNDLVEANAAAWQWWLSISPYNYKDGLIYIDKNKTDGSFTDSKMLWALGNYSRFIRPGMQRINCTIDSKDLQVSAYKNAKGKVVLVFINSSGAEQPVKLNSRSTTYTTSHTDRLRKRSVQPGKLVIPAESIVTVIIE
jgi:O-glycosyl hydrolase